MKFDKLVKRLDENQSYRLNQSGQALLQKYHQLIEQIERAVIPLLTPYVKDPTALNKEIAVQIISSINSQQLGNEEYEIMSRLDTLTSGGKNVIDGAMYTFNQSDPLLKYVEITA